MAIYVFDPEAALAFRRNHRRGVVRQRYQKRREQAEKPRDRKRLDDIDRAWLAAVDRDRT
jgi:hypothetical protein